MFSIKTLNRLCWTFLLDQPACRSGLVFCSADWNNFAGKLCHVDHRNHLHRSPTPAPQERKSGCKGQKDSGKICYKNVRKSRIDERYLMKYNLLLSLHQIPWEAHSNVLTLFLTFNFSSRPISYLISSCTWNQWLLAFMRRRVSLRLIETIAVTPHY